MPHDSVAQWLRCADLRSANGISDTPATGRTSAHRGRMATMSVRQARRRAGAPDNGSLERRRQGYRYGIVLLLLIVTYVVEVAAPGGSWSRVVTLALEGFTLLVAMAASGVSPSVVRVTTLIVGVALLAAVFVASSGATNDGIRGSFFLISALLVLTAPIVIVRGLMLRPVIDARTVLGALCVYVLIGMLFAFTYATIGAFSSHAFFAQQAHATISDYLYFSFVTLTTVGYGDLTAAGGLGRAVTVLEALLGQIYLVTVVALLVGAISGRPRGTRPVHAADGDHPATEQSV